MGLQELLYHALNEGPVYSALVPWVLDCTPQVIQPLQAVPCCALLLLGCCWHVCWSRPVLYSDPS